MKGLFLVAGATLLASSATYAVESVDLKNVVSELQAQVKVLAEIGKCRITEASYNNEKLAVRGLDKAGNTFEVEDTYDIANTHVERHPNNGQEMIYVFRRLFTVSIPYFNYTYRNPVVKPKLIIYKDSTGKIVNLSKSGPSNYLGTLCQDDGKWSEMYQQYYASGSKYAAEQAAAAAKATADAATRAYDAALAKGSEVSKDALQGLKTAMDAARQAAQDAADQAKEFIK